MNPYLILGLKEGAGDEEVRSAYQTLVRKYTPENAPKMFQRVNKAYKQLETELARTEYKLWLAPLDDKQPLADLVPEMPVVRKCVGVNAWLDDISGGEHG